MAPLIGFASFPSIPWKCASVWNATHRQITNISLRSFPKHMIRQVQVFGGGWNSYMSIVFYLCTYTYICEHMWYACMDWCMMWLCNAIRCCMYCWISTAVLSYAPTRAAREREVPCGGIYVTTHIWCSLNHMHSYTHMRTAPHCTYTTVYILNHCYALFEQEKWKIRAKEKKKQSLRQSESIHANWTT